MLCSLKRIARRSERWARSHLQFRKHLLPFTSLKQESSNQITADWYLNIVEFHWLHVCEIVVTACLHVLLKIISRNQFFGNNSICFFYGRFFIIDIAYVLVHVQLKQWNLIEYVIKIIENMKYISLKTRWWSELLLWDMYQY